MLGIQSSRLGLAAINGGVTVVGSKKAIVGKLAAGAGRYRLGDGVEGGSIGRFLLERYWKACIGIGMAFFSFGRSDKLILRIAWD